MILTNKLEIGDSFSKSERIIADYFLKNKENALKLSTQELADATYTSASTVVRLCQKLGLQGYNEFKEKYSFELQYIQQHFSDIDANFPFNSKDSYMTIANKIGHLTKETVDDTLKLLNDYSLSKAVDMLANATNINVYAVSNSLQIANDFKHKMLRINKHVEIMTLPEEQLFVAMNSTPNHCAILISYSGETFKVIQLAEILKDKNTPMIGITSIGENKLSSIVDCVLNITSRERLYSKIGTFSTNTSTHVLLDILYSCIFRVSYQKNLDYKIKNSRFIDTRKSSLKNIKED